MENEEGVRAIVEKEFFYIPLKALHSSPTNPRKYFDADALKELARSMEAQGVIEPLIVRPAEDGKYEVVAGERRLRAAKLLKLHELPCRVRVMSDRQVIEVQLVENLERRDLSALEEAEGFAALIELSKKDGGELVDVPTVATRIGKSVSYVYQRVKLTELIDPLKQSLVKGKITPGHAILLARLTPVIQKELMEKRLFGYGGSFPPHKDAEAISVRDLARCIQKEVLLRLHAAPFDKKMKDLVPAAGACTTCPKRTGSQPELWGDIEIKDNDTCSDALCYKAKNVAWIEYQVAKYTEEGKELHKLIHSGYQPNLPKGILQPKDWALAEKPPKGYWSGSNTNSGPCGKSVFGIFVDDGHDFPLGKVIKICIDGTCVKHWQNAPKQAVADNDYHQKQLAEQKKLRAQTEAKGKTLDRILGSMGGKITLSKNVAVPIQEHELAILVAHLLRESGHDVMSALFKRHTGDEEWKIPEGQKGNYSFKEWLEKAVPKWTDLKVWRLCMELMLLPAVASPMWDKAEWRDEVMKLAVKGYGVEAVKPEIKKSKKVAKKNG